MSVNMNFVDYLCCMCCFPRDEVIEVTSEDLQVPPKPKTRTLINQMEATSAVASQTITSISNEKDESVEKSSSASVLAANIKLMELAKPIDENNDEFKEFKGHRRIIIPPRVPLANDKPTESQKKRINNIAIAVPNILD